MGQGDTSPNIWTGGHYFQKSYQVYKCPRIFEESYQVYSYFVDFVAFYFTETHILL